MASNRAKEGRLSIASAAAIDADSVHQHRDDMIAIAEIDENATNEANFDETKRSTEVQESIQFTPDSAAISELDNCREAAIEQESGESSKETIFRPRAEK